MRSKLGFLVLGIVFLFVAVLVFSPYTSANKDKRVFKATLGRSDNAAGYSLPDSRKSLPDLFKLDWREQGSAGQNQTQTMTVGWSIKNDESPALRDMKLQPVKPQEEEQEANENPKLP